MPTTRPTRTPIAITGAACVLPGAPNVEAFARLVLEGRSAVTDPVEGRFGVPNANVRGDGRDRAWSLAGGYVEGFVPDVAGLEVAGVEGLDPLVQWLLHCSKHALGSSAGTGGIPAVRTGAVLGNLSFPSDGMARWGEGLAKGATSGDPRNHFMSGLPAAIVAQAFGLEAGATCVDAACASSIYALKLACDALESGRADRMLAGAVQRADSLFLHVGFCQLGAMSKTGQSRPFHKGADGLVPAEGCVVFTLRRLEDAVAGGEPILGVIRGIGLSNDGRGRSLLAPSSEGQQRAMRSALGEAGWDPGSVQLFECHATGTPTGDKTEVESLRAVYPGGALGSLKSNFGHLITVAGAAGLLKVLVGMRAETLPPTLNIDDPLDDLGGFTLLGAARPWAAHGDAPRRAAVSAFGFGGNNGHVLVEQWNPGQAIPQARSVRRAPLAVLALVDKRGGDEVAVALEGLRFPPTDLQASLPQQTLFLQAGRDAFFQAGVSVPRERLGVYAGMACDGRITRWGLRWRAIHGTTPVSVAPDELAPPLRAEHVVGTMPNIVANRLGVQLDAAGPGFTLSAEEVSGLRALDAAWDALDRGEIDLALVGAVDLPTDPRAVAARHALGRTEPVQDAAVVLVVARAEGVKNARIVAWLDENVEGPIVRPHPPRHGAADGLVALADAIRRGGDSVVQASALGGQRASVGVRGNGRYLEGRSLPPTGPVLRMPMHPVEAVVSHVKVLPRAPSLVPVGAFVPAGALAPATLPPLVATALPSSATHSEATGAAGWESGFVAWRRAVGNTHGAYVDTQAQLHTAFLQSHAAMTGMLLRVAGMGGEAVAPQAPPPGFAGPPPAPRGEDQSAPAPLTPPAPRGEVADRPEGGPRSPAKEGPLPGPRLSRAELEMGANGSITTIFGPDFVALDAYKRVVRMPEPPLLLADRVLGIEGPVNVLGKGRIVTETDITDTSWYLHDGRMPGGLMIESGQADLLLGSWQGIDFLNQSERIYRLLGCTLTYKGELPGPGDTLQYDIRIDQHAKLGDVRMFFFRYDCYVGEHHRLSVREGQAGYFTDEELANSGGCLWDAETHDPGPARVDPPRALPTRTDLDRAALEAFGNGDLETAFGAGHRRAHTHTWTPRTPSDRMLLLDRVSLDLAGGPWKRGYLRAELDIRPDLWFFHGHFHNDPCMPGTLMFDGCLQAMYILLAAGGHTLDKDGWRFEPIKDVPFKLRCRGQVTPTSKKLVYEVFVSEVHAGPVPRLVAQVMCTVDGLKCFHADPMGVELVPDWPLTRPQFAPFLKDQHIAAPNDAPPAFDWKSLLACGWGRPTDAFGPMYVDFDGPRKVPRLPGPPYHFMSRVPTTTGKMGAREAGCSAVVEYDVPQDAWYFKENGHPVMPYAVLLEAALQPCGWLASWSGCAVGPDDFLFRNLDGTTTVHKEITPETGMITTTSNLVAVSKSAGMILVTFTVALADRTGPVLDMKTVFGFFPPAAFENQVGVGSTDTERARLAAPAEPITIPDQGGAPACAGGRLMMLNRAFRCADGWVRGEKDVNAKDWFFKAHFYRDPVQPGSLGIEALLQLLQVAMVDAGLHKELKRPRFEPIANGEAGTWKYRGQVVPENRLIQSEVRILETRTSADGVLAFAEGHLWVDGKKIYTMPRFAMRVREDERPAQVTFPVPVDHRPTWTLPATAMLTMAMQALAWAGADTLEDGVAGRWLTFPDEAPRSVPIRRLTTENREMVVLGDPSAPHFKARLGGDRTIPPLPALVNPRPDATPGAEVYGSGRLFHGPSFQAIEAFIAQGENGATALLRAGLPPDVLLDGMTHSVPHDAMESWFDVPAGSAAYPMKLRRLVLAGALPQASCRIEVRALRLEKGRPIVGLWLFDTDTCIVYQELEEVLLPKGPIGTAPPEARRAFLQGRYTPGVSLSRIADGTAQLTATEVRASDWLPGTIKAVYGTDEPGAIAVKELAGAAWAVHPRHVHVEADRAWSRERPLDTVEWTTAGPKHALGRRRSLDLDFVTAWWRTQLGTGPWAGERVLTALAEAWLSDFRIEDAEALARVKGPVLFLANHESYLESVLFTAIAAAHVGRPIRALAKVEHQGRWLGKLHAAMTSYPGHKDPPRIAWFDQDRPASLRHVLDAIPREVSLLVHVEGTRQVRVGQPITKVSSIWTDLAIERGWPVVPVAFRGGVNGERTDVPVSPQTHIVGRPITAETLKALPYAERRQRIAEAIDALGHDQAAPPSDTAQCITDPGKRIVAVIEQAGALAGADPEWARRVRSVGTVTDR